MTEGTNPIYPTNVIAAARFLFATPKGDSSSGSLLPAKTAHLEKLYDLGLAAIVSGQLTRAEDNCGDQLHTWQLGLADQSQLNLTHSVIMPVIDGFEPYLSVRLDLVRADGSINLLLDSARGFRMSAPGVFNPYSTNNEGTLADSWNAEALHQQLWTGPKSAELKAKTQALRAQLG